MLVQVHQHVLLQCCLAIVNADAVVMSIEAVNESLDGGFVEMSQVGCALSGFLTKHERLWVD